VRKKFFFRQLWGIFTVWLFILNVGAGFAAAKKSFLIKFSYIFKHL